MSKQTLNGLLCRIGWHRNIGVTVGGFVRCYMCSRNLHKKMRGGANYRPIFGPRTR